VHATKRSVCLLRIYANDNGEIKPLRLGNGSSVEWRLHASHWTNANSDANSDTNTYTHADSNSNADTYTNAAPNADADANS
jgi:hypothetical protein